MPFAPGEAQTPFAALQQVTGCKGLHRVGRGDLSAVAITSACLSQEHSTLPGCSMLDAVLKVF